MIDTRPPRRRRAVVAARKHDRTTFVYDEVGPALDPWQVLELEQRLERLRVQSRGPGKSWNLPRPFRLPPGVPAYQPTGTLVPAPRPGPLVRFSPLAEVPIGKWVNLSGRRA
jgi:hypothetical protein